MESRTDVFSIKCILVGCTGIKQTPDLFVKCIYMSRLIQICVKNMGRFSPLFFFQLFFFFPFVLSLFPSFNIVVYSFPRMNNTRMGIDQIVYKCWMRCLMIICNVVCKVRLICMHIACFRQSCLF